MSSILQHVAIILLLSSGILQAEGTRWGLLGDDNALEATFDYVDSVVLVCVFDTELCDVRPPFIEIVYHATVVESHKGPLKVGEKIRNGYVTRFLPNDEGDRQNYEDQRRKFLEERAKRSKGALMFAFLPDGVDGRHRCEFMEVPAYSRVMQDFLRELQRRRQDTQAEKGGADQPTTAPE